MEDILDSRKARTVMPTRGVSYGRKFLCIVALLVFVQGTAFSAGASGDPLSGPMEQAVEAPGERPGNASEPAQSSAGDARDPGSAIGDDVADGEHITPGQSETASGELTFGSAQILGNCWSSEELRGKPEDRKGARSLPSDAGPPTRLLPGKILGELSEEWRNSIRQVKPYGARKLISLTFDLCERGKERSGYDATVVNYLRDHRIKATFFAGGKWMRSHSEKLMQLMADPLFEVGNHTWAHENLRLLKHRDMSDQILWTQAQYEILREELQRRPCCRAAGPEEMLKIPQVPLTFRFPYGTCSSEALDLLARLGLPAIQWTIVTGDPGVKQTAQGITREVLTRAAPGSIVILHANGRGHGTAEALPLFIPQLIKKGYEFVTVSELLRSGRVVAASECYELRPGDNLRYDRIFGAGTD